MSRRFTTVKERYASPGLSKAAVITWHKKQACLLVVRHMSTCLRRMVLSILQDGNGQALPSQVSGGACDPRLGFESGQALTGKKRDRRGRRTLAHLLQLEIDEAEHQRYVL